MTETGDVVTSRITKNKYLILGETEPTLTGERVFEVQSVVQPEIIFPARATMFEEFGD